MTKICVVKQLILEFSKYYGLYYEENIQFFCSTFSQDLLKTHARKSSWCHSHGHSVSCPSLSKVADFLCWLRSSKNLSVSSVKGYRSMLCAVFSFHLPSLSTHAVLRDLLRSFCLESAERQLRPPAWDLSLVLRYLNTSAFEPLSVAPLRALTQKVLFLLALATAKRVGELQALSSVVTFVHC